MSFISSGLSSAWRIRVCHEDSLWMGPGKLAKCNAEQVARATDRRESRHCLTMINGRCA